MRCFIGFPVNEEIKNIAVNLQKQILTLNIPCRLVPPENFHLTLVFLGGVPQEKTEKILTIINEINKKIREIELVIKDVSVFPNQKQPRLIFINFQKNKNLEELVKQLKEGLKKEGFVFDEKPFVPHLTISRLKKPVQVNLDLLRVAQKKFVLNKIFLYQSFLSSKGASYQIINQG